MSTLTDIETAAAGLPLEDQQRLHRWLSDRLEKRSNQRVPHSVLDIPPASVGRVLQDLASEDDLLGEMLEEPA